MQTTLCSVAALAAAVLAFVPASTDDPPPATHLVRVAAPPGVPNAIVRHLPDELPTEALVLGSTAAAGTCGPLVNGGFHNGLYGWTTSASPSDPPTGAVELVGGAVRLSEGRSFLTTLAQSFCVPEGARALRFQVVSEAFDQTANAIPDAFEVSLVDGAFQSVVPTWSPQATSYFNIQEDGSRLVAPGVSVEGGTVELDLSTVAAGTEVFLYFDLIGADDDHGGFVEMDDVALLVDGEPGVEYCMGIACPCGNDFEGGGCANSLGTGGALTTRGTTSVGADDLILEVSGAVPSYAYFFVGRDATCVALGDGFLAASPGPYQNGLRRLILVPPDPNTGMFTLGPGILDLASQLPDGPLTVLPGETWHFQAIYRDGPGSPCGTYLNLTNAVAVTFEP